MKEGWAKHANGTYLVRALDISADTVKEYINKLRKKGIVRRVGPDRGGYWEVLK